MVLQKSLQQNSQDKTLRFYHVGTNPDDFKSFFKEGAKPVGQGVGGQGNGLYVWTNEDLADNHIRFLNFQQMLEEALIVGVDVEKEKITYPEWQADMEYAPGFCKLLGKHKDYINQNMQNLNINLPPNESFLNTIQSVKCEQEKDEITLTFKGGNRFIPTMEQTIKRMSHDNPCRGATDSVFFQTLADYLCQNSPDFKKDYDHFMQQTIQNNGLGLKYTGKENQPVSIIKHATVSNQEILSKSVIFDAQKKEKQVCPFIAMALKRKTK